MKPRLISIASLMVVVAAVALNLAVARMLAASDPVFPVALAVVGLAVQAGILLLIRSRGRSRAFWTGFVAFGSIALATAIWALIFAPNMGIAFDPSTGTMIATKIPGSPLWTLWSNYFEFVDSFLVENLQINLDPMGVLAAIVWSLPQLLLAVAGGMVAFLFGGRWHARARSASGEPSQSRPAKLISTRI